MNSQGKNSTAQARQQASRALSKKIIVIAFGAAMLFVIAYFAISAIIAYLNADPIPEQEIYFYPADWEKNIMQDKDYLALDRNVYFFNTLTNTEIAITDENSADVASDYAIGVNLLRRYIKFAIAGKHEDLNKLFSDAYYKAGFSSKEPFTMQQIYDIRISNIELSATKENGNTYQTYSFWVEYKIRENNGTFRNDVGSDGAKKEKFIITNRNGVAKIDAIVQYSTKPVK